MSPNFHLSHYTQQVRQYVDAINAHRAETSRMLSEATTTRHYPPVGAWESRDNDLATLYLQLHTVTEMLLTILPTTVLAACADSHAVTP